MTPRKHQSNMFWLGAAFTMLHLTSPVMWPFYTLTGFMLFLWMATLVLDWWERRLDAELARIRASQSDNAARETEIAK